MGQPKLERHPNGIYYIHWTAARRSARMSTGRDSMRDAMLVYAGWIVANIDMLFPPSTPENIRRREQDDLQRLRKARGMS